MNSGSRIPDSKRPICAAYLYAKRNVISQGFETELEFYRNRIRESTSIDERQFLEESAWVILSTGFRERIIARLFPELTEAFNNWLSARWIVENEGLCLERGGNVFNHPGKLRAIVAVARIILERDFNDLMRRIRREPESMQEIPYIGPVTQYHLAKNIGLRVAKPDRHVRRISVMFGYGCVWNLCREVENYIGDPVPIVDTVFWRYASVNAGYQERLSRFRDGGC